MTGVKRAPSPDFAIPGGIFDESWYAWMIYAKYVLNLPYSRLAEELWAATGVELNRQTTSASGIKVAEALRPLYELMKCDVIDRDIIFTDETPVRMLDLDSGKTRKVYIWVYVGGGSGPPYRIYEFTAERNHEYPEKFRKNFHGLPMPMRSAVTTNCSRTDASSNAGVECMFAVSISRRKMWNLNFAVAYCVTSATSTVTSAF